MSTKKNFSELLVKYMSRTGVKPQALANKMDIRRETIYLWMDGKTPHPKCGNVKCCAEILRLDKTELAEFLTAAGYPYEITTENTKAFIEEKLLDYFVETNHPRPMLLLAQVDIVSVLDGILASATTRYAATRCCHIALPQALRHSEASYFSEFENNCGFSEPISDSRDFEGLLRRKLSTATNHPYFLLVSSFESTPEERGREFASILRSLNEQYPNRLHVILCGGQKLHELKFLAGKHSLLNNAEVVYWPEMTPEDVYLMRDECSQQIDLNAEVANELLTISGGHPALLKICLEWYQQSPSPTALATFGEKLSNNNMLLEWFTPFFKDADNHKITAALKELKVAPFRAYFNNSLLRTLYWKNLLVKRDNQLYWRCEAIRLAGEMVFTNFNSQSSDISQ